MRHCQGDRIRFLVAIDLLIVICSTVREESNNINELRCSLVCCLANFTRRDDSSELVPDDRERLSHDRLEQAPKHSPEPINTSMWARREGREACKFTTSNCAEFVVSSSWVSESPMPPKLKSGGDRGEFHRNDRNYSPRARMRS